MPSAASGCAASRVTAFPCQNRDRRAIQSHETLLNKDACSCFPAVFQSVGGAIGAAGAIATAPFRHDTYAYNDGYGYRTYRGYDNGFVCQPGTIFRGEDGRRHICQ
jgi:hypothetical protein